MASAETRDAIDYKTIKIPAQARDDPEGIDMTYEFDPADYQPDGLHGFCMHAARRDYLGVTWLEYINAEVPETDLAGAIGEAVARRVGGDIELSDAAVAEVARRVIDDLSGDVREAAYVGAGEAIQDAR